MDRIEIYDTTLRDGTQGEGFNLSLQDKLMVAAKLDELGVDYRRGRVPAQQPQGRGLLPRGQAAATCGRSCRPSA